MLQGEMTPVFQLMRALAETRLLLDVEVITTVHLSMIGELVTKCVDLIPVSLCYMSQVV